MNSVEVEHFIKRATDFLESMRLTRQESHLNSAALLAIHCALSYNDALRTGLGTEKLALEDHQRAVDDLDRLLVSRLVSDRAGLIQLKQLLSRKSRVAYGNKRLTEQDFLELVTKAERFAKWANNVGKELKIEGWRDAS